MRKIGLSIESIVANFENYLCNVAYSYMKEKYDIDIINLSSYDINQIFVVKEELVKKGFGEQEATIKSNDIVDDFWNAFYSFNILQQFIDGVKKTINQLYSEDHEIFVFSSKGTDIKNSLRGKIFNKEIDFELLLKQLNYHHLLAFETDEKKLKAIENNYIDIMIDSDPEILAKIATFTDAICISSLSNGSDNLPNEIKRVSGYENDELLNAINYIIQASNEPILPSDSPITNVPSEDQLWLRKYVKADFKWSLQRKHPYERMNMAMIDFPQYRLLSYCGSKNYLTNEQFAKQVDDCARKFNADGIKKGDIVPVIVLNNPETAVIIVALMKLMVTIVPISPAESQVSIETKLSSINSVQQIKAFYFANAYISQEKCFVSDKVKKIVKVLNIGKVIYSSVDDSFSQKEKIGYKIKIWYRRPKLDDKYISIQKYISDGDLIEEDIALDYSENHTAFIIYTGGTVESKGVMISASNIDSEIRHFLNSRVGVKRNEKISSILPYDHIYGLIINLILPICKGVEVVQRPKPERKRLDKIILTEKVTYFATIPVLLTEMLKNKRMLRARLPHVKQVFSGGGAIVDSLIQEVKEYFKERGSDINIIDGYGSSELTAMCLENGIPIIGATPKIVQLGTETELGYDEQGELCISSDTVMQKYFNNKQKSSQSLRIHSDGKLWFHTGDLAYIDKTGKVVPKGRIDKDIIKVNGQMVNLFDISTVIEKHPGVKKCVVLKQLDDKKGEVPIAFVAVTKTFSNDCIMQETISKLCDKILAYYEIPKDFVYLDSIPINPRGKIDENKLLEIYKKYKSQKVRKLAR